MIEMDFTWLQWIQEWRKVQKLPIESRWWPTSSFFYGFFVGSPYTFPKKNTFFFDRPIWVGPLVIFLVRNRSTAPATLRFLKVESWRQICKASCQQAPAALRGKKLLTFWKGQDNPMDSWIWNLHAHRSWVRVCNLEATPTRLADYMKSC